VQVSAIPGPHSQSAFATPSVSLQVLGSLTEPCQLLKVLVIQTLKKYEFWVESLASRQGLVAAFLSFTLWRTYSDDLQAQTIWLPLLTPVAAYEGRIVASNLLKGNHRKVERMAVPTIVFTIPPLAAVGLLEHAAQQKGLNFKTTHEDTSGWYSSRRVGEESAGFKVLIENESDRVLGAHVIGPHADELINVFALAMQADIPASRLKHAVFGYPTLGSDVKYML